MIVKGPSGFLVPALCDGLGYVMEKRGPSQPYIVVFAGYVVDHGERVLEIVLMPAAVYNLNPFHRMEFRHYIA